MDLQLDHGHLKKGDILKSNFQQPTQKLLRKIGFYRNTFTTITLPPLRYIGGGYIYHNCQVSTRSCLWYDWLSFETTGNWLYNQNS